MTTEELAAAFPPGNARPSRWKPGAYAEYDEAHRSALAAERFANAVYGWYRDTDVDDATEAVVWQVLGLFDRFAAALTLESVVLWDQGSN